MQALTEVHKCAGCAASILIVDQGYQCPTCEKLFCHDCNVLIHEKLFNCPHCCSAVALRKQEE